MTRRRSLLALVALASLAPTAHALDPIAESANAPSLARGPRLDPIAEPELAKFIDEAVDRHGFERAALNDVFASVTTRDKAVVLMDRPAAAQPWWRYRANVLSGPTISQGVAFYRAHRAALERAEREFGVPWIVIVGILGIETHYGRAQGGFPALDTLATLAFRYPRRSALFKEELMEFLLLARSEAWTPALPRASFAGALGMPQFMPSSYRALGVDFDGDGHVDLFGNPEDVIGSIAHFLARKGWVRGAPVLERVPGPEGDPQGFVARNPGDATTIEYFVLDGRDGLEYFRGYANFNALIAYNRSLRYATAVVELGQEIRAQANEPVHAARKPPNRKRKGRK